ncbi:22843_t:CDS:2 [Cetraspora pellucida]|uniref:22843_t:CDS:1 n=1 Tax=Cetraspora pellucida TaxID=1433469 RepID=A0A9N9DKH6_9GLOM|nr:22843_t:CDS:2 [Cetraspora pellucida]
MPSNETFEFLVKIEPILDSNLPTLDLSTSDLPISISDLSTTSELSTTVLLILNLFIKDKAFINHQLLKTIILSNASLSFVEISTDILDNVYENVQRGNNIFAIYKEIGISFDDKWIVFILNSRPDFKKAQCLMQELVSSVMLKPQYSYITHWATFTKASKIILQVQKSLKVIALMHSSYLNSYLQENNIVNTINNHKF